MIALYTGHSYSQYISFNVHTNAHFSLGAHMSALIMPSAGRKTQGYAEHFPSSRP